MAEGGDELQEINDLFNDHFGIAESSALIREGTSIHETESCSAESEDRDIEVSNDVLVTHYFEQSLDHENENPFCEPPNDLMYKNCGCENECMKKFSSAEIVENILSVRDMLKEEKEQLIMTVLSTVKIADTNTKRGSRKRSTYVYSFQGKRICRQAFMVLYDITDFTLRTLSTHVNDFGISPGKHGNTGKKPVHAINFDDVMRIVTFLRSYADENGLPQPAAPRGRDDLPPIYLHSSITKKEVHAVYVNSLAGENARTVKRSAFCQIWKSCVPHIVIASPRYDVSSKCEQFRKKIIDAVIEAEKLESTTAMQIHIQLAQAERDLYLALIGQSKTAVTIAALSGDVPNMMHYTFDFAQNVTLPHHARQMGPLYFLSLKKVQVFGFRSDGDPRQLIYLFDESQCIGVDGKLSHGPNSVISMMHDAFIRIGKQEETCSLHADNCAGQNKNRYVLAYLLWRVMTGLHKEIELHMQIPGHSRCLIDAGFANFKRLYRRCDADALGDLSEQVNKSSTVNEAVMFPDWIWYDWKTFCNQYFKALTGISSYHISVVYDRPGMVFVKKTPDGEERSFSIIRDQSTVFVANHLPEVLTAGGLSIERQTYLYRSIRPYVRQLAKDETCPLPNNEE